MGKEENQGATWPQWTVMTWWYGSDLIADSNNYSLLQQRMRGHEEQGGMITLSLWEEFIIIQIC